nr:SH2 domain containing 3Cb isoform X3 [Misgurnus anguillicaudatus]
MALIHTCHASPMENGSVYVKFSRETCLLSSPSEKLKKELEKELKLSSDNLSSHGWYHGCIPWEVSESLTQQNGNFLIRDSLTSIGDYVLTCCWNQNALHFLISKVLLRSHDGYSRVQYVLEGETFDSVPALVHSYVVNPRPLTKQSGAYVYTPVNRTLPLRYLETMFGLPSVENSPVNSPTSRRGSQKIRDSEAVTEALEIDLISPQSEVARSFDATLEQHVVVSSSPTLMNTLTRRRRSPSENRKFVIVPSSPVLQHSSEIRLCSSPPENTLICLEPTLNLLSAMTHSHQNINRESIEPRIDRTKGPVLGDLPSVRQDIKALDCIEEYEDDYLVPFTMETVSCFRASSYQSPLLPAENKPLETRLLKTVKDILFKVDVRTMAMHITKADCMVARILDVPDDIMKNMGVSSGMELLTLPHGHRLRQDLLERFHTMSIMLAVQVLGCTGSVDERAALLHKIISLAYELQSNMRNMFGFAVAMKCLEFPQITRLGKTWAVLRQKYTESAVLYEKTLRPSLRSMNDGEDINGPAETTLFPHVLPLLFLLEKTAVTLEESESWESVDTGVAMILSHLDTARTIACNGRIYSANAEAKLQGFQEEADVWEVFLTEFQMRLLWGSRGVERNQDDRFAKFDEVLSALSNRLELSPT